MEALKPVDTRPLFLPLHLELMELLQGLDKVDWSRPTVAGTWGVRDIVAHLLDVQSRDVSILRDSYFAPPDKPITSHDDLLAFLDRLNADWIRATGRLSPSLLLDLLSTVGEQAAAALESQSMGGEATFPVDWAGVDQSRQWMHVGRQYTEYWHHQMQIRDAVGVPRLLADRWLKPLLDLSIRALPRTYDAVDAPVGTTVTLTVKGTTDRAANDDNDYRGSATVGVWTLKRTGEGWSLLAGTPDTPTTTVRFSADESWRLLYNARSPEEARQKATVSGEDRWTEPLWRTRSVMVREPDS